MSPLSHIKATKYHVAATSSIACRVSPSPNQQIRMTISIDISGRANGITAENLIIFTIEFKTIGSR